MARGSEIQVGIAVIGQRMICLAETMDSSFPREVGARG